MSDISYTWEDYIDLNEKLVALVAKSGWHFDSILCLARGGMRPGDFFSRVYDMPLAKPRVRFRAIWTSPTALRASLNSRATCFSLTTWSTPARRSAK